jgi:hypothetical protein
MFGALWAPFLWIVPWKKEGMQSRHCQIPRADHNAGKGNLKVVNIHETRYRDY